MKTHVEKLNITVDIEKILYELKKEVFNYENFKDQINLQIVEGKSPYYGSREGKNLAHSEKDFFKFFFNIPYTNSILFHFDLYRSRVMNLKSKTCLSYHKDPTKRFHIPIVTNENCFFIIDKKYYHLPADGSCYIIDSTLPHTAVNASFSDRVHIIGTLVS